MIEASVSRRYAKALLDLGKEKNLELPFLNDLNNFEEVSQKNPVFCDILSNRFMDLKARLRIIDDVAPLLKLNPLSVNFLKIIIEKGRVALLPLIVEAYRNDVYVLSNKMKAIVTSAKPLNDALYNEIQKILSKVTNKEIVIEKEIRPEVIGGVSICVGGEVFDGTVQGDLNRITEEMKQTAL